MTWHFSSLSFEKEKLLNFSRNSQHLHLISSVKFLLEWFIAIAAWPRPPITFYCIRTYRNFSTPQRLNVMIKITAVKMFWFNQWFSSSSFSRFVHLTIRVTLVRVWGMSRLNATMIAVMMKWRRIFLNFQPTNRIFVYAEKTQTRKQKILSCFWYMNKSNIDSETLWIPTISTIIKFCHSTSEK